MATIDVPHDLCARLSQIAAELPEFESTEELVEYVLESAAMELERELDTDALADDQAGPEDDDAVEERLEDLGYL
jgi:hypothetical protein